MSTSMPGIVSSRINHLLPAVFIALLSTPAGAAPAPHASCLVDRNPARITRSVSAEYPVLAKLQGFSGMSVIRVNLAPTGKLESKSVQTSSGSILLDRAALTAAQAVAYAPETKGCQAVAGSYLLDVSFE